ncbi:MAG: DedA family protein [Acidobacteriota bacterium]|nr:DedA family protein [Acidobacteriota bacterium]
MTYFVHLATDLFLSYGVYIIFVLLILENFPFVGFVAPGISILVLAGFLCATTDTALLPIIIAAFLGAVVGDNLWFFIGRAARGRLRWVNKVVDRAPNAVEVTKKYPLPALVFYPFAPYFRMFLPTALGAIRYDLRRWFTINLLGSILFVLTYTLIGRIIGGYYRDVNVAHKAAGYISAFFTVAIAIYAIYILRKLWKKRKTAR